MGGRTALTLLPGANGPFYSMPGVYGTLGTPDSTAVPSGRGGATTWTDSSGNFWLYGGQVPTSPPTGSGFNINGADDIWEFNPSLGAYGEWAWMGGSSTALNQVAVYGALGTPAAGNTPGGRHGATGWTDTSAHFWLFSGQSFVSFRQGCEACLIRE